VTLELLDSARDRADYRVLATDLAHLNHLPVDRRAEHSALQTQAALAQRGEHWGPTPIDLLIAAVAATNNATLLHYDGHFDVIARVTGQPAEWLARRGSLG
jgi:predicted nucleic acid-binding protein